jgi:hypothetical protein
MLSPARRSPSRLRDFSAPPVIDTSSHNLATDFFTPALRSAIRYDRGVGYFSSGWLRVACEGMIDFAARGGRGRWVTSPILDPDDWEAMRLGDEARTHTVLRERLAAAVGDLKAAWDRDLLSVLAWMVADGILTFKLAVPRAKLEGGEFHDKFGVFYDAEGDAISFNGSYNDSIQGTRNYESLKVFRSWDASFAPLVAADIDRFERLWENCDPNVRVYELPEAIRAQILQLRSPKRPYHLSPEAAARLGLSALAHRPLHLALPDGLVLRAYQELAIERWFEHGCRGLFEMATGTGKTITALAASVRLAEQEGRLAVIIVAPYQHLVDQWRSEAEPFGYRPILAYQSRKRWETALNEQVMEFNGGFRPLLSVITTRDTFTSPAFQAALTRLSGPALLIADEAHHLGAEQPRRQLPTSVPYRLALSATPDRWYDDEGTAALREYFGSTVFALPLEEAIGVSLTPYYYFPHLVPLTEGEFERYQELSPTVPRVGGIAERMAPFRQVNTAATELSARTLLTVRLIGEDRSILDASGDALTRVGTATASMRMVCCCACASTVTRRRTQAMMNVRALRIMEVPGSRWWAASGEGKIEIGEEPVQGHGISGALAGPNDHADGVAVVINDECSGIAARGERVEGHPADPRQADHSHESLG